MYMNRRVPEHLAPDTPAFTAAQSANSAADSGKDPIMRGLEGALSAGALTNVVRKGEEFEEGGARG